MNRILALSAFAAAFLGVAVPSAAFAAVNLNTATHDELVAVPGIGPAKAQAIVEHRNAHGPFASVDDLKEVKGFRAKLVEKLRPEFTVAAPPPKPAAKGDAKAAPKGEAKGGKGPVVASGRIADEKPRR
ncbi:MAG: helix-hairpin-helix domain-containing protein [Betaproteobacteria bacterium PRO3]|nr:helix-hairpin-helix domain-containing protein [Betaproteobacteria bacterium PRO3]